VDLLTDLKSMADLRRGKSGICGGKVKNMHSETRKIVDDKSSQIVYSFLLHNKRSGGNRLLEIVKPR
jgi:hypothetical protein